MDKYERVMRKCERFYNHPKVQEVYDLRYTMIDFLIPRIELFLEKSGEIVDWDFHKKIDNIYIERDLRNIVKKLKYIKEHMYDWDPVTGKKCDKYLHEVTDKLGEIFFYLWY